ncbi:MAG: dihydroorotate dehydrogenase electron transfer subunit [Magnetococcales bacterium]|nr:dihydroorotate dehydrogenase electron transfer subunit [Magnetococcales bacterium]
MGGTEQRPRIYHRQATLVRNLALPDRHHLLRLQAPWIAAAALPGQFVHMVCGPELTLPRPFSILDADPATGMVDLLYRVVGTGTAHMAAWQEGMTVTLAGPVGRPFSPVTPGQSMLLLAGGVGLAPLDFLARRAQAAGVRVVLLLGTESTPPFATTQANVFMPGIADVTLLALTHLERLGIVNRLAALHGAPGFFRGYVTDLAREFLASMDPAMRADWRLFACGPPAMLAATARLIDHFGLAGEVSMEARMACGFGGCAGCAVPMLGAYGEGEADKPSPGADGSDWHYQRVCVDGPVFDAAKVAWERGFY